MTLWTIAALLVAALAVAAWLLGRHSRRRVQPEHVAEARRQAHETVSSLRPDDWPDTDDRVRATDEAAWQDQALAIADHTDKAMRRLTGDDERGHAWTHLTAEEAADCRLCSPSSLPRHIEEQQQ